ncbi:hypothetical protein FISHEDRAFT_76815 [Fistulina hepatica ATCC 64428]|uniref:Uncharacterized protein n=1 Tax=Fistulina hepatica ATCC 64428 TaxID=1128425 RepID=A0A0D7A319_9AGAR|nr:hypothetical protein FISHEDRAFT_76815 [Fistulina hepatica ATCC 64428]
MLSANTRDKVWVELLKVARPDSRFHFDFSHFIADFNGSDAATRLLVAHSAFRDASVVFITPDNCLEDLRYEALRTGKTELTTTYGIRRRFWMLDSQLIKPGDYRYAATLDGMERVGQPLTLADIRARYAGESSSGIQMMVTGTGAINHRGIRFGKAMDTSTSSGRCSSPLALSTKTQSPARPFTVRCWRTFLSRRAWTLTLRQAALMAHELAKEAPQIFPPHKTLNGWQRCAATIRSSGTVAWCMPATRPPARWKWQKPRPS